MLQHDEYLAEVELNQVGWQSLEGPYYVHKLTMLQVVHQDVNVLVILGHTSHGANEVMVELCHIFDFMKDVFLLL